MSYIHGNQKYAYDHVVNGIFDITTGTADSTTLIADAATESYRLRADVVIFTVLAPDGLSGAIYKFEAASLSQITYTDTTTSPFVDYSDDMSNYVRVGTTSMVWLHQRQVAANYYISTIPIS